MDIEFDYDELERCEECGSTEDVKYRTDPYRSELYGDDSKRYICDSCYKISCEEI